MASTAKPLAGRTKLERRLEYLRPIIERPSAAFGFLGLPTSDPVGFAIEPMWPDEVRAGVGARVYLCIVCALSGALSASIIAILIFVFTH